jgi:hypothetical protein
MRSKNNRFGFEGGAGRIFYSKRPHYRRRGGGVRHGRENTVRKMRALLAPSRNCRPKCGPSRFVRPLRKRGCVDNKNGGASLSLLAAAGEPANVASPKLAVPRRDVLLHVLPLHKRNTDLQSVRPVESSLPAVNISVLHLQHSNVNWVLHSADRATNSSAPSAGNAAAGYKPAGRTGQRPVFRI